MPLLYRAGPISIGINIDISFYFFYYSWFHEVKGPDHLDSNWGNPERLLDC